VHAERAASDVTADNPSARVMELLLSISITRSGD
jgi:hypothetical protein